MLRTFLSIFIVSVAVASCSPVNGKLKKEMNIFKLEPGLRMELIAAEPLVLDPVAMAFDELFKFITAIFAIRISAKIFLPRYNVEND